MNNASPQKIRIVIFAKAPVAYQAKTRLIPALGADGAAQLAKKLLSHTLQQAIAANIGAVELCVSPSIGHPVWQTLDRPAKIHYSEQGEGDLGERMARAASRVCNQGEAIILIGTDCPALNSSVLQEAAAALQQHHACMVPVSDGGYALLGLNQFHASLFQQIPWSTSAVAPLTQQRIAAQNWRLQTLSTLHDIDEPQDLHWLPPSWL